MRKFLTKQLYSLLILIFILTQAVPVHAQDTTAAPVADNITVTNNAGIADTIYITGLFGGEKVCVYSASTAGKLLSSVKVSGVKTETTIKINQLGTSAGAV
ncbi:MAG: hypothetical protein HGA22_08045, partial [Clostridiales bacterium]|nr:hypothetical protein [Clostridiales bacterium]